MHAGAIFKLATHVFQAGVTKWDNRENFYSTSSYQIMICIMWLRMLSNLDPGWADSVCACNTFHNDPPPFSRNPE